VYGLLVDVENAAFAHLVNEAIPTETNAIRDAYAHAATGAGEAYREAYGRLALLLPEAVTVQLQYLDFLLLGKYVEALAYRRQN
jgi:hypothetical protein